MVWFRAFAFRFTSLISEFIVKKSEYGESEIAKCESFRHGRCASSTGSCGWREVMAKVLALLWSDARRANSWDN